MAKMYRSFRWLDYDIETNMPIRAALAIAFNPKLWLPMRFKINISISKGGPVWKKQIVWMCGRYHIKRVQSNAA